MYEAVGVGLLSQKDDHLDDWQEITFHTELSDSAGVQIPTTSLNFHRQKPEIRSSLFVDPIKTTAVMYPKEPKEETRCAGTLDSQGMHQTHEEERHGPPESLAGTRKLIVFHAENSSLIVKKKRAQKRLASVYHKKETTVYKLVLILRRSRVPPQTKEKLETDRQRRSTFSRIR